MRAEDPDDATVYDERAARITLDRTAPVLSLTTPVPESFVSAARPVHGSIADPHLLESVLTVTPAGGATTELARHSRARNDEDLASLAALGDGPHTLDFTASDLAENRAEVTVPFTIDSTPPLARLLEG